MSNQWAGWEGYGIQYNCDPCICPICHCGAEGHLYGGCVRPMSIRDPIPMPASQGWECPHCRRVYGPSTPECFTCNRNLPLDRPESKNDTKELKQLNEVTNDK